MSAPELQPLLRELEGLGIQLRLDGEALRFTAPSGALTAELRARLQACKPALIAHLRSAPLPASLPQRRFWALQQLDPDWAFYNVPFLFQLRGRLDAAALHRALDAVVARHDSLRTTLHQRDGILVQVIAEQGGVEWREADLLGAPDGEAECLLRQDMLRAYDFAADPALRATLLRTEAEAFLFQLCLHNVVFDMASMLAILAELSELYASIVEGRPALLATPVQYAEYTRWQAARIAPGMARRMAYWQDWFARGEQTAWTWPARDTQAMPGFDTLPSWARLSAEEHAKLQSVSRAQGVTVTIAVLAAYLLGLRDFLGCDDLTIGTTYSDRDDNRFEGMVGASIVVPALRVDMRDQPTLPTLLHRVRDVLAAALANQDLPLDEVLPDRPKGPLFRMVCTAFADTPHGKLRLPGIRAAWREEWWNPISRPALYLVLWETPGPAGPGLTCHMMHRQDVWDAAMVERMNTLFQQRLHDMIR